MNVGMNAVSVSIKALYDLILRQGKKDRNTHPTPSLSHQCSFTHTGHSVVKLIRDLIYMIAAWCSLFLMLCVEDA